MVPPVRGGPAAEGVPPDRVGAAGLGHDRRAVPRARPAVVHRFLHHQARGRGLGGIREEPVVRGRRAGKHRRPRSGRQPGREGDRPPPGAAVPPGHTAGRVHLGGGHDRRGRPGPRGEDHHREAVRHRPGLSAQAEPGGARVLRRVADLPHRPLPGQGIGRQHPGLPVRQRAVRTGLEPLAHPVRADRRAGDADDRGAGRVLRRHRRLPGHGGDPPVPGARVRGHGTAGVAERRAAAG